MQPAAARGGHGGAAGAVQAGVRRTAVGMEAAIPVNKRE
jgi:hypothetical protein